MSDRRDAPVIPGLTLVEHIGSGGFADVYQYDQKFPSRKVAVKVLHAAESDEALAQFHAEANVMAQLSGHPAIVAIHAADVGADGRPYIVMEYCPPPALAAQYRTQQISLATALDTGIRIASAVETVHRAGLLHRDIKPANILTSAFGAPKLTDFGIAGATGEEASYGMSVPWAPPEWFSGTGTADPRGDVFSLAATVYSLIAGRSPFEVPGAANDNATLMNRIERQPLARLTRADVPASLNEVLARAMSKRPEARPSTALDLARQLQDVQTELGQALTRIEVFDASPSQGDAVEEDQRTFIRPVQIIVPDGPERTGTMVPPRFVSPVSDHTDVRPMPGVENQTLLRGPAVPVPATAPPVPTPTPTGIGNGTAAETDTPAPPRRRAPLVVGVAAAVVLAAGIGIALTAGGDGKKEPERTFADQDDVPQVIAEYVEPPTDLRVTPGEGRGELVFAWEATDPRDGDQFGFVHEVKGELRPVVTQPTTTYTATVEPGDFVCGHVMLVRSNGQASPPSDRVCAEAGDR